MTGSGDEPAAALIEISVPVEGELVEPIWELFERHGGGAVLETRVRGPEDGHDGPRESWLRTYVPAGDAEARLRIELGLWHLGRILPIPEATFRPLVEANWAEAWKAHYVAQRIGPFLVVPSWIAPDEAADGAVVLRLDPGMAFGTGQHPTTRLCLAELAGRVGPSTRVLDVGTGSGILAIGAALLGAPPPVALDIDPRAVETALANASANGVALEGRAGTLDALRAEGGSAFDLVLANLLAGIVEALAPDLAAVTAPGGTLIASGILDEQAPDVVAAIERAGFEAPSLRADGDWVAIVAARAGGP